MGSIHRAPRPARVASGLGDQAAGEAGELVEGEAIVLVALVSSAIREKTAQLTVTESVQMHLPHTTTHRQHSIHVHP